MTQSIQRLMDALVFEGEIDVAEELIFNQMRCDQADMSEESDLATWDLDYLDPELSKLSEAFA